MGVEDKNGKHCPGEIYAVQTKDKLGKAIVIILTGITPEENRVMSVVRTTEKETDEKKAD